MSAKVWLIGEQNPHGTDPCYALFPWPAGCAGARLCHGILGMPEREYLRVFERRNLLTQAAWSAPRAREAAAKIRAEAGDAAMVLLGARVAAAFGFDFRPFEEVHTEVARMQYPTLPRVLVLPHPSGRNRAWNDPDAAERARARVAALLQEAAACAS